MWNASEIAMLQQYTSRQQALPLSPSLPPQPLPAADSIPHKAPLGPAPQCAGSPLAKRGPAEAYRLPTPCAGPATAVHTARARRPLGLRRRLGRAMNLG